MKTKAWNLDRIRSENTIGASSEHGFGRHRVLSRRFEPDESRSPPSSPRQGRLPVGGVEAAASSGT